MFFFNGYRFVVYIIIDLMYTRDIECCDREERLYGEVSWVSDWIVESVVYLRRCVSGGRIRD